jgi:hypothetical protein
VEIVVGRKRFEEECDRFGSPKKVTRAVVRADSRSKKTQEDHFGKDVMEFVPDNVSDAF